MSEPLCDKENFTVLPYKLGGNNDPFFMGDGSPPIMGRTDIPFHSNETDDNLSSGVENQETRWQSGKDTPGADSECGEVDPCQTSPARPTEQNIGNQISPRQTCGSSEPPAQNLSLDRTEATCAWYDRPDWDEPGIGGANDWMLEDKED